jgi:hypothetical protein
LSGWNLPFVSRKDAKTQREDRLFWREAPIERVNGAFGAEPSLLSGFASLRETKLHLQRANAEDYSQRLGVLGVSNLTSEQHA